MINKNMIRKYLDSNNIDLGNSNGISINSYENELVIKGSKLDLIELADYIVSVAVSDNNSDHIHIDNLSLLNNESNIKDLVIEKGD